MPAPDSAALRLAQVRIGAVHVGIPAASVVQALPVPDAPAFLPRRQGALRGVIEHAGRLVPVIDLARWVDVGAGPAATAAEAPRILVLHEDGFTLGLHVDAVGGLVEVPAAHAARLHHDGHPDEVFHTAARASESGAILSLLDVGRLAALAAVWNRLDGAALGGADADGGADAGMDADAAAGANAGGAAVRTCALLRLKGVRLAVPAADLTEVIPMPALEGFGGGVEGAWCLWRGRHLPVLPAGVVAGADAGAVTRASMGAGAAAGAGTGVGAAGSAGDGLLAVIEHEGLALGLRIEAALALDSVGDDGVAAADGFTSTVFDQDGGALQLLDTARLFARFPEAALGRAGATAAAATVAAARTQQRTRNDAAYIVFEAQGLGAVPIDAVEHILPLPAASGADPAAAPLEWDGAAVALVDLRPAAASSGHVLLVRQAGSGRHVGYVVARVDVLIPPGTGELYRMAAGGRTVDFITTGEGAQQASYRIVELAA